MVAIQINMADRVRGGRRNPRATMSLPPPALFSLRGMGMAWGLFLNQDKTGGGCVYGEGTMYFSHELYLPHGLAKE